MVDITEFRIVFFVLYGIITIRDSSKSRGYAFSRSEFSSEGD